MYAYECVQHLCCIVIFVYTHMEFPFDRVIEYISFFGPPLNAEYSNYYFALNHHRIEKFNGLKTEPIQARIMRASARTDHGRL